MISSGDPAVEDRSAAWQSSNYVAFISYSHADGRWARRLHRQMEAYRLPKDILHSGRARLGRVFLDRSELSTSTSLSLAIQRALDESYALIVICSPRSAASRWVNEEVRRFRSAGRGDRIFCLIVDGDPAGITAPSPFPPTLLETLPGEAPPEHLAADIRPGHDRPGDALLKLIAGIVGVPFDALRRRDLVRRQRRLAALATVSTALLLVMTGLAITAMVARREAERQRDTALRTATFMRSMFDQARPEAGGAAVTVRTMLDRSASETLTSPLLRNQPETRADLLTTLAQVFAKLGSLDRSEALLRAAAIPGDEDVERLTSQAALAAEIALQRSDYVSARKAIDVGLSRPAGNRPEVIGQRIRLLTLSGQVWSATGDPRRAEADFAAARQQSLAATPPDRGSAAAALTAAALADVESGALDRAEQRLRLVIGERRGLGQPLHPNVLTALNSLGALTIKRGDAPSAERYFRQAIALQRQVLGDQHLDTATSRGNLGRSLVEQHRFAEARTVLELARTTIVSRAGPDVDSLANIDDSLGLALAGLNDAAGARASFARGLMVARKSDMPKQVELLADGAELDCGTGRAADGLRAVAIARTALARFRLPEAWRGARIDMVEAECRLAAGQRDAALPLIQQSVAPVVARWGKQSLFGARAMALARSSGASASVK